MYSSYDYSYNNYAVGEAFLSIFLTFTFFLSIIIGIYKIIVKWNLYKKAGKEGWEAIIPFYSGWTYYEICGYPGYFIFFIFIPYVGWIVNLVCRILAALSLAKKFKKSEAFGVFLIAFLPVIGLSILAFGNSKYDHTKGEQKSTSVKKEVVEDDSDDNEDDKKAARLKVITKKETVEVGDNYKFCGYCGHQVTKNTKKCTKCGKEL